MPQQYVYTYIYLTIKCDVRDTIQMRYQRWFYWHNLFLKQKAKWKAFTFWKASRTIKLKTVLHVWNTQSTAFKIQSDIIFPVLSTATWRIPCSPSSLSIIPTVKSTSLWSNLWRHSGCGHLNTVILRVVLEKLFLQILNDNVSLYSQKRWKCGSYRFPGPPVRTSEDVGCSACCGKTEPLLLHKQHRPYETGLFNFTGRFTAYWEPPEANVRPGGSSVECQYSSTLRLEAQLEPWWSTWLCPVCTSHYLPQRTGRPNKWHLFWLHVCDIYWRARRQIHFTKYISGFRLKCGLHSFTKLNTDLCERDIK